MTARVIRYRQIADELRSRIVAGEFAAGAVLPSEAALSDQYGASRVTIRRALDALRAEGIADARQGFGWYVAADPLRQELGALGTIEAQLRHAGVRSERRILSFGFIDAPDDIAAILGERSVLEVDRLNLADGQPFALVTVWCTESLGANLSRADVERSSFLEQLPIVIGGATQSIGAEVAGAEVAHSLDVPVGSPLLVARRITRSADGTPVLVSRHVFAAHRTEFVVDLPAADDTLGPSGLRLVD